MGVRFLWGALLALAFAVGWGLVASPAAADTFITGTGTDQLMVLEPAGSPYVISADFHVLPGGFVLVSAGVTVQFDNGAALVGDGGAISATGTSASVVTLRARPGGNGTTWGGIVLYNGTELTLHRVALRDGDPLLTIGGLAVADLENLTATGCGAWCIRTSPGSTLSLRDSSFTGGVWGLIDGGATAPQVDQVTFGSFSTGGIWFTSNSSGASITNVTVQADETGLRADALGATTFVSVSLQASTGAALWLIGGHNLRFQALTLVSTDGTAAVVEGTDHLVMEGGSAEGRMGALLLTNATTPSIQNMTLRAGAGACISFNSVVDALLRGNALGPCWRSIDLGLDAPANTANVDTSNTVEGRPIYWLSGQSGVEIGAAQRPGFIALFDVSGANLTGLNFTGTGIYIFGCRDVHIERVEVEGAPAGLEIVGSQRVTITQFIASGGMYGIRVRPSELYAYPVEISIDHARVDDATAAGFRFDNVSQLTMATSFVAGPAYGVELDSVRVALLSKLVIQGIGTGIELRESVAVTLVDSLISGASTIGLRVVNSTGLAARNAFEINTFHATAPGSPRFAFNETGGGNYWSGFTGPDPGGDGFSDTPYIFTDGTGTDFKPRLSRLDFPPVIIVKAPSIVEIGVDSVMDVSLSFDDFTVAEAYWEIEVPGLNFTASGFVVGWGADVQAVGSYRLRTSILGSFGALDEYFMTLQVVDTLAPTFHVEVAGPPEAGGNATIVLANATDNDPSFPANMSVAWTSLGPSGLLRTGTSTHVSFAVPVDLLGTYNLTLTVKDATGNAAVVRWTFQVFDTQGPEVLFLYEGEPDLGFPFVVDASQTQDPTGLLLDGSDGPAWSWVDTGTPRQSKEWPVASMIFNDSGPHNIVLHICDLRQNCIDETLRVVVADRSPPVLEVLRVLAPGRDTVEVSRGENGVAGGRINEEIVFEVVAKDASGNMTFSWDFGDGGTAQGARVAHRFTKVGEAVVTLTMRDSAGNANPVALRMNLEGGGVFGGLAPGFEAWLLVAAAAAVAMALQRLGQKPTRR